MEGGHVPASPRERPLFRAAPSFSQEEEIEARGMNSRPRLAARLLRSKC
jgi:hypothetical protein